MDKVKRKWVCRPSPKQQKLRKYKAINMLEYGQELDKVGSRTSRLKVSGLILPSRAEANLAVHKGRIDVSALIYLFLGEIGI